MSSYGFPRKQGLYDPQLEHESCGIGMVVHLKGVRSRQIVLDALQVLQSQSHRGAQGCDSLTGDGAGILTQIPHFFLSQMTELCGFSLPESGDYGVGMVFLPRKTTSRFLIQKLIGQVAEKLGFEVLGWRSVPVDTSQIGPLARSTEPHVAQVFIARGNCEVGAFERKLYVLRRLIEKAVLGSKISDREQFYVSSFSSRTLVYKGLLLPRQLSQYYLDLQDSRFASALAIVHSRFSTNTFPTWALAHPYRYLCHNGEINTIQGNINWMRARQASLHSELLGEDLARIYPIITENQSDSASLDNALEFLVAGGRSIAQAMMMLIPEPWTSNRLRGPQSVSGVSPESSDFYEYYSAQMEPWDGPAAVCFTDGLRIGAKLDRNGLRPCRYQITTEDVLVLASEAGVLPMDVTRIREKGRLEPGKMLLVDLVAGSILDSEAIQAELRLRYPYREWIRNGQILLRDVPLKGEDSAHRPVQELQLVFGYTREELQRVLIPMATEGEEPSSSMGNDTPLAVLSRFSPLLFKYFRQMFAQVTNPPIDPIRESLVMSLVCHLGPRHQLFSDLPSAFEHITLESPILRKEDLEKIRSLSPEPFLSRTLPILFKAKDGSRGLRSSLRKLCMRAEQAVRSGHKILILSDRGVNPIWAPIPSLLAVSAVHQHLIRKSIRAEVSLILESGEPRDVHHFACLLGYGAEAVCPYLVFQILEDETLKGQRPDTPNTVNTVDSLEVRDGAENQRVIQAMTHPIIHPIILAIHKGLLKIFSKMGISTLQSYCGAQIFEAIGLSQSLVKSYFTGTISRIGGIGLDEIAADVLKRHTLAFSSPSLLPHLQSLPLGGEIHYRAQEEHHSWNPATIFKLQQATRLNQFETFSEFSKTVDEENQFTHLRGLLEFRYAKVQVPLSEVESASAIVRSFTTGAMSFGALGKEAHETLAFAMNRIGAKSNSGEGGEDPNRYRFGFNRKSSSSAIKQVASARFGVTTSYLVNALELQIKIAQGAKPGEGGQLPGHKVDAVIAKLRYSTPGVQLISPPPHHDIYSIEDLAQLIFDLKKVNPTAVVSVKLVAEAGVGTVAAGVVKAGADKILISGDSGGTGASPLSSIKYAGIPWEMGLAETHQTLVLNRLRDRVRLETDGQLKTGRDVVIAALLGAEEYGFSTAPLIVEGCVMMRKCHLNTCPVGIATQDPELRQRFNGQPEHIVNYFFFLAEEVRILLSRLGVRSLRELIGRTDFLHPRRQDCEERGLDLSPLFHAPEGVNQKKKFEIESFKADRSKLNYFIEDPLEETLIQRVKPVLCEWKEWELSNLESSQRPVPLHLEYSIRNTDRAVGARLSGEIVRIFGSSRDLEGSPEGLPFGNDQISIKFSGAAGQSFGAFLCSGVTLILEGEANDSVGKGLSGGKIIIFPPSGSLFSPESSVLIGNTTLYGATRGEVYLNGTAGERFAVRNSGAIAVVEGVGDHGCEYMTGGIVLVLGKTGRNFAAGMSGGVAFVLDEEGSFRSRCNLTMVELESELSFSDLKLIRNLIEAHDYLTRSRKAAWLLNDWENLSRHFVKVVPTEFKTALLKTKTSVSSHSKNSVEVVQNV